MNKPYEQLKQFIDNLRVIDTHEHLIEEKVRLEKKLDFGVLMDFYTINALKVAGLSDQDAEFVIAEGNDIHNKWQKIAPFWRYARYNDYCRAYMLSMNKIYGIPYLNENTYEVLSHRIQSRNQLGILRHLINEVANVERCIVNSHDSPGKFCRTDTDTTLFSHDIGFGALFSTDINLISAMEQESGMDINSFDDLLKTIDWYIDKYSDHAVSIKIQSAYYRSLYFEDVDKQSASSAFDSYLKDPSRCPSTAVNTFQNYMFHHIIKRAIDHRLPVRIHTGYLAGTNYMKLEDINPSLLTNIFRAYPTVCFSLFHIGYPYFNELLAIAKHYRNVYVDLCWGWIIDSEATKQFLKRFILTTPINKLFGFGGDFLHAELIYGHLEIARHRIAEALSELIAEGILNEQDALFIAQRILRDNAIEFFALEIE